MGLRSADLRCQRQKHVQSVLREIARSKGQEAHDVSRAQIMLNPALASAWSGLATGRDVVTQLALKLARVDKTVETEELSELYGRSGFRGDVQSGILLCPWRSEGWQKLGSLL